MTAPAYSCRNMPTIQRFMASDAFIRGLVGPLGGGKSSGCVWDLAQRGVRQKPGPDGVRRSRWVVIRNCYDDQTEILTEHRGWVLFAELLPSDKVATLKDGKELTFEMPSHYYAAPYQGEMIGIKNEGIDLLVTPEHKLWVTKTEGGPARRRTPFRHETAERCFGMIDWRMKRDAEWQGFVPEALLLPGCPTLDLFEFLGLWFAEGYAGIYTYPAVADRAEPHYRLVISQKREAAYTRELLTRCGMKWGEHDKGDSNFNFTIGLTYSIKALVTRLSLMGKAVDKAVPDWIKGADTAHLRAFLTGYLKGDGHLKARARDVTRGYTASRQLADDLQEIALKVGMVANVGAVSMPIGRGFSTAGSTGIQYVVTFLTPKKHEPYTKKSGNGSCWFKAPYDGMVYCLTVSSHVVYVRRGGRAVWCGQTNKQLEDSTIRTFLQWFPPHIHGSWLPSKGNYTLRSLKAASGEPNAEIEFQFRALDRPDQIGNLLSTEYTGGWINEGREVPWAVYEALIGRIGRYPAIRDGGPSWFGLIADTNPPDTESEWYSFFEEQDHTEAVAALSKALRDRGLPAVSIEDYAQCFKQPSGLGPSAENLENLPPGYYARQLAGKSEDWIKVYLKGEYGFTVDGKPVWPEYEDSIHCPSDENKWPRTIANLPVYRTWDFGITPAVVFSQITPDGRWIVVDEMVATDMQFDQFSDEVVEHSGQYFAKSTFEDHGDPSGNSRAANADRTCFQIAQAKGIGMNAAPQHLRLRIEATAKPMRTLRGGKPQFVLHPRCKRLRRALMGGYHYRRIKVSGERYTDEPDKNVFSHVADALGYGGAVLFGSALRGLYPQDDDTEARAARGGDRTRSRTTGY